MALKRYGRHAGGQTQACGWSRQCGSPPRLPESRPPAPARMPCEHLEPIHSVFDQRAAVVADVLLPFALAICCDDVDGRKWPRYYAPAQRNRKLRVRGRNRHTTRPRVVYAVAAGSVYGYFRWQSVAPVKQHVGATDILMGHQRLRGFGRSLYPAPSGPCARCGAWNARFVRCTEMSAHHTAGGYAERRAGHDFLKMLWRESIDAGQVR